MGDRTVTSPVGDSITIFDDDDFAVLLGVEPGSRHYAMHVSTVGHARARAAVLHALWHEGAVLDPKSGRAGAMLRERALRYDLPADSHPNVATNVCNSPSVGLCIARETNAKRTYAMRLVALPDVWYRLLTTGRERWNADRAAAETVAALVLPEQPAQLDLDDTSPPDIVESTPEPGQVPSDLPGLDAAALELPDDEPRPIEIELTNAVATALLAQVVEIISTGNGSPAALKRLQVDYEAIVSRLGEQTTYGDRLRRQLREAGDEIHALKLERDGLRVRLRVAEHNLRVAAGADANRIIDAEVRRQVDRFMRETPNGVHSKQVTS